MSERLTAALMNEIYDKTTQILSDALGVDDDEVTPEATLRGDLGAEDIDFLDIVFRTERAFDIRIRREDIFPDDVDIAASSPESLGTWRTVSDIVDYIITQRVSTGELVVETQMLRFFLGTDGRIIVAMSMEDGSWGFADGSRTFPSHLVLIDKGYWADVLRELEDLINNPDVSEQDLQRFLAKHSELVKGEDYDLVVPQAVLSPVEYESNWKMDFVARPIDQNAFVTVLELKKPQMALVKKSRFEQNPFSSQLYEAIQQLRRYARAFQAPSVRDSFRTRYGIDVYRPDLHLIAGRSWDIGLANRFRDLVRDEQVFVENWDSAIERMRRKFT